MTSTGSNSHLPAAGPRSTVEQLIIWLKELPPWAVWLGLACVAALAVYVAVLVSVAVYFGRSVEFFGFKIGSGDPGLRQEIVRLQEQNVLLAKKPADITRQYTEILSPDNRSILEGSGIRAFDGPYLLKTFTYYPPSTKLGPTTETIDLKGDGRTVYGVMKQLETGFEYKLFGYHRIKYLVMSYGGSGPLGGGSIALQIEPGASKVFWGWRTSVECTGVRESLFLRCPVLMYPQGVQNPEEEYPNFLDVRQCQKVTIEKPLQSCDALH